MREWSRISTEKTQVLLQPVSLPVDQVLVTTTPAVDCQQTLDHVDLTVIDDPGLEVVRRAAVKKLQPLQRPPDLTLNAPGNSSNNTGQRQNGGGGRGSVVLLKLVREGIRLDVSRARVKQDLRV